MSLLLDTHALLWWLSDDPALQSAARAAIREASAVVYVSAATAWEISIKKRWENSTRRTTSKQRLPPINSSHYRSLLHTP